MDNHPYSERQARQLASERSHDTRASRRGYGTPVASLTASPVAGWPKPARATIATVNTEHRPARGANRDQPRPRGDTPRRPLLRRPVASALPAPAPLTAAAAYPAPVAARVPQTHYGPPAGSRGHSLGRPWTNDWAGLEQCITINFDRFDDCVIAEGRPTAVYEACARARPDNAQITKPRIHQRPQSEGGGPNGGPRRGLSQNSRQ
jgi:hypothetical protein